MKLMCQILIKFCGNFDKILGESDKSLGKSWQNFREHLIKFGDIVTKLCGNFDQIFGRNLDKMLMKFC